MTTPKRPGRPGEQLEVRLGASPEGAVFKILPRTDGVTREHGNVHVGTIAAGWTRIGVLASKSQDARFFVIEPSNERTELAFQGFYVRGPFRIAEKENNPRRAREAWDLLRAAAPIARGP